MTDQPMELWFGYFCMVLPRTLQIGYLYVLLFFLYNLIIDRVRHSIHLFFSGADRSRAKPFFHSHLGPWSSTYGKDQDHMEGGTSSS